MECRSIRVIGVLVGVLSFTFLHYNAIGQAYHFERFSVNEGMPNMIVWDIYQDSDGFLWVATGGGGLSRFDGSSFHTYDTDDGLRDNFTHTIFEDQRNRLWVSSYYGGVARFEGGEPVYQFTDTKLDEEFSPKIYQDDTGDIWFATYESGVFIYDGRELEQVTEDDGLASNTVWDIHFGTDEEVWVATSEGVSVLKEGYVENHTPDDGLSGDSVFRIIKGEEGDLWLATNNGITRYDGEFHQITEIGNNQLGSVFDIAFNSNDELWIGTELGGIFVLENGNPSKYNRFTNRNGLSSNYIYRLYEDRNDNMWVGTSEKGMNLFRGKRFRFINNRSGLPSDEVLSIYQDSSREYWIGTGNGLYHNDGDEYRRHSIPVEDPLDERIWEIAEMEDGQLLLLLENSEIWTYADGEFQNFSKQHQFGDWFIYDFYYDQSQKAFWLGTDSGLVHFQEGEITHYDQQQGLPASQIYHIHPDHSGGTLWLSTSDGIVRFNGEEFEAITYEDGLPHQEVHYITQDKPGDIWAGTPNGVVHYEISDESDGNISHYSSDDGMFIEETVALWYDNQRDHLWQATHAGIQQLDLQLYRETGELEIIHHRLSRVGKGVEINYNAVAEDHQGRALFGSMEGVIKLDPSVDGPSRTHESKVRISGIEFNGRPVDWDSYADRSDTNNSPYDYPEATFPYGNNTLSFRYNPIEYIFPENVILRYKLEGLEQDWNEVQDIQHANYNNLPAGDYTFRVQVRNLSGVWGDKASYSFAVNVPYWQTFWFWGLLAGLVLLTGYISVHYRRSRFETEMLHKKVDEQTRELTDALKDKDILLKETHHRVKNNLAVIYSLLEMQKQYLDSDLSIQIINDSQLRINTIAEVHENLYQQESLSKINAQEYIRDLVTKIANSFNKGESEVQLNFDIDLVHFNMKYAIPCGLILNELVTNAYKYAFEGRKSGCIDISLKRKKDHILLTVSDDGIGIQKNNFDDKPKSLGMTIVKSLTRQLEGELNIDSSSKGTRFDISIFKKHVIVEE